MTEPALRRLALSVLMPGFTGTTPPPWLRRTVTEGLAGVCLFGHNVEGADQVRALTAALRDERPDVLVASDEEGGSVTRLDAGLGSPWPGAATLGALDDPQATYDVAVGLGRQARACGVDLVLAPVVDVNSEPDNPVIGVRSFGASTDLVSRHGAAFVRGLQDAGVAACAKHFPGHGATTTDSHVGLPVLDVSRSVWSERDLPPFAAVVDAGTAAVMTAHVVVRALDDQPATTSAAVLRILRDELGFDGVVVSDALDMRAIADAPGGRAAGAARALAAGVDLLCVGNPTFPDGYDEVAVLEEIVAAITAAVTDGTLPLTRLEEASRRVGRLAARPVSDPLPAPDRDALIAAGTAVAARALTVAGDIRLRDDAVVVVPRPVTGYAAGRKASALVAELQARRPGWRFAESLDDTVPAEDTDVLVVVEGADTVALAPAVAAVLDVRPDAVVVHGGLRRADDQGARTIHTHGSGAATARATALLLLGEEEE
ncbi:beta-N-acetylhexosaminidase [Nocardioides iriomotensis]|uniref:Beta-N-acetylhexosaminidase n=1 Tax=Nocardioides iriomotensis TaxID=715784 RepID=A0A4Q5J090_9ACTN|nr:beta-N-acetylhexosaminidase [Nocardioides iriomotensis]RYU11920.1 beta-N-acetylhexosaminidase [Nocardioides iriomotensis]